MMDRRTFLAAAALPMTAAIGTRANVLIITTDEQFADACSFRMGKQFLHTPNMDRLAASGQVFSRAYCANPLCVPQRNSMYTGHYPTETGVMDNEDRTKVRLDPAKFPLMGKVFRDAGYDTAYFGKWHLTVPEKEVATHGFVTCQTPQDDPVTASGAVNFLRSKPSGPFLMVASFLNPHNIAEWARGQKLSLGDVGQPPPLAELPPLRQNHLPQKNEPDIVSLIRRSYQSAPMFPVAGFDEKKWREYIWAYYRMIEKVDAEIGKVLDALHESGLEKDTLVVFTADHGDCMGAHGWNQKTILFEESVRVPFILSKPGTIRPGTSSRLLNTGVDLLPTVCDYAGIAPPVGLPGLSLAKSRSHQYVVVANRMIQGLPVDGKRVAPTGRMVRGDRFKYTAWSEGTMRESLVDLENDPGEMLNLAGDPKWRKTQLSYRATLKTWCHRWNDTFFVA